jgi:hypothetical protein
VLFQALGGVDVLGGGIGEAGKWFGGLAGKACLGALVVVAEGLGLVGDSVVCAGGVVFAQWVLSSG